MRPDKKPSRRSFQAQRLLLLRTLLNAVAAEMRRHGFAGFLRRLPYHLRHLGSHWRRLAAPPPAGNSLAFEATPSASRSLRLHPDLCPPAESIECKISIVIPTLNAGIEFRWLLCKLVDQQGIGSLEIVIVDSGSTDGTVQLARDCGCSVIEIPSGSFSHGNSRNTGADAASGDYLLFMVQDAYPIGNYWIYGMLSFLREHSDIKLAAVSCAEFSRSDSDMMYDWSIKNHYSFLGCDVFDRIGEFRGEQHTLLRSYGQLSNVACLMSREIFQEYHFRGDYAEDLDLGIRLIRYGYKVAMLSSIRVIHSHNRSSRYYLKRSFVDTIYLVRMFDDYAYPCVDSHLGLIAGIASSASRLTDWLGQQAPHECHGSAGALLMEWIKQLRKWDIGLQLASPPNDADTLDAYLSQLAIKYIPPGWHPDKIARQEARSFFDAFLARLDHFARFVGETYESLDSPHMSEVLGAISKNFAAAAGSSLGFMYLDLSKSSGPDRDMAEAIRHELSSGV